MGRGAKAKMKNKKISDKIGKCLTTSYSKYGTIFMRSEWLDLTKSIATGSKISRECNIVGIWIPDTFKIQMHPKSKLLLVQFSGIWSEFQTFRMLFSRFLVQLNLKIGPFSNWNCSEHSQALVCTTILSPLNSVGPWKLVTVTGIQCGRDPIGSRVQRM